MSVAPSPSPEFEFGRMLQAGRFFLQRCRDCARVISKPRTSCPSCGSRQLDFVEASGRGVVYSTTVVRRPAEAGGDYNVALVELAEGPRVLSRVEAIAPHLVEIGMPVGAVIRNDGANPLLV